MDPRTWTLALNTLLLAGAACAISVPLGSVLAWLLVRTDLPARRVGVVLLGLMLFVPLYLQAAAWQAGFGVQGWMTLNFGVPPWMEGWVGAIWVHGIAAVPWVVLIVGVGLLLVEPELEEQALLDTSPLQVFLRVTLCGALPAVGIAALWVAIFTGGEIAVTDLFVVRTYAEEVYTRVAVGPQLGDAPLGLAPGIVLVAVLIAGGLVLCAKLLVGARPITLRRRRVFRLGAWRAPMAIVAALLLLLLIGVPLANLCYKAGVLVTQTDAGRVRSWSAGKCLATVVAAWWRHRREVGWSLAIGALSATAAVFVATLLAWWARGDKRPRTAVRGVVLVLVALCLALPGPVLGVAIIRLLNRPELPPLVWLYDRSILAPWLALLIRSLPLATLVMWHALRTVPQEMLDAAAVDGAGPIRRLCFVALPCRLPAVALAWVVALAVSLGDLAASVLVLPPGVTTLSVQVFDLLHSGVEDRVAGLSLAMIVLLAATAALAGWLARGWARRQGEPFRI